MARPHLFCATRQIEYFATTLGYSDIVYLMLLAAARAAIRRGVTLSGFVDRCLRAKARAADIEAVKD